MSQFLRHETAMALTIHLLEVVSPCPTTESERKEAFDRLFEEVMTALRQHDEKFGRELRRLARPSEN